MKKLSSDFQVYDSKSWDAIGNYGIALKAHNTEGFVGKALESRARENSDHILAKVEVEGSNPFARSILFKGLGHFGAVALMFY